MGIKIKPLDMLPLAGNLVKYLQEVIDHMATLKASGIDFDEELLATFISSKMAEWKPKIKGKMIFDDETRNACARFISGIAFNLYKSN